MIKLLFLQISFFSYALFAQESLVEITLKDKLDEPRGFCFDTRGFQHNARPDDGLQTHTCYSYQGQLAIDQAFNENLLKYDIFKLDGFNACMSLNGQESGSSLTFKDCEEVPEQSFKFNADGLITPLIMPHYCITAGPGPSILGGMGMSPGGHLIRTLTIEECSKDLSYRQKWRTRKELD